MEMRRGRAHGVFLKNSNGMDVILNTTSLTYKVIGGKEELQVSACGAYSWCLLVQLLIIAGYGSVI